MSVCVGGREELTEVLYLKSQFVQGMKEGQQVWLVKQAPTRLLQHEACTQHLTFDELST